MYIKTPALTKSILITLLFACLTISVAAKVSDMTMSNLNKALRGEANASHRYELFAKKADSEGYKQIAKLFRAVSMAESVHENNHRAVILTHGGHPDIIEYDIVKVGTTKENLQIPLKGETYEKNVMYPKFIKQAKVDKMPDAVKTFTYAENAEKQHEKLFRDAYNNLGKNKRVDYFVSKTTGATYALTSCSMCPFKKFGPEEDFIQIR